MLAGTYINQNDNDPKLAQKALLNNYKDEDIVEAHAYPLYWLAENSGDKQYVDAENYNQIKKNRTNNWFSTRSNTTMWFLCNGY